MGRTEQLFRILADGQFHSGEALSEHMGVSRSSVWNHIRSLRQLGLDVFAVQGQGYRLAQTAEPIDLEKILRNLDPQVVQQIPAWDIHWSISSSNAVLSEKARQGAQSGHVCLTEMQTAGRGRRGRVWCSPLGANVYLSMLWRFQQGAASLSGLNIATAVALTTALHGLAEHQQSQIPGLTLKWPNDVFLNGKKLAGILMEVTGEASGPCAVVLGVGLNVSMNADEANKQIDQPWTDLSSALPGVSRNQLIACLVSELVSMFQRFEVDGLQPFLQQWQSMDAYSGKPVQLQMGNQTVEGVAKGIASNGALLVEVGGELRSYHSGEISIRKHNSEVGL